ncbi:type IV pilus assembly protein, partial [Acidithiobacillus sp. GGI-221]
MSTIPEAVLQPTGLQPAGLGRHPQGQSEAPLTPVLRSMIHSGLCDEARLQNLASDPTRGKTPLLFYAVEKGVIQASALMSHLSARYNMPM